jgi:hypothetical protein
VGPGDLVTAALILAGAAWLLYRSFARTKGGCHGCAGAGCRPPSRDEGLVRLGGDVGRRRGERDATR